MISSNVHPFLRRRLHSTNLPISRRCLD
uniref:Putative RNA helicase SDE3 n=1 Tax=Rhizophora mucronata TaxID=61149 RepID=A0A2P2P909_RHIMU